MTSAELIFLWSQQSRALLLDYPMKNSQLVSFLLVVFLNSEQFFQTLLRNRGPVRTSQGQCYSKWSVTWSTYLIQSRGQVLYDSITVHTCTPILTAYMGTTKLTAIKLKTRSFNNLFFTHLNKQNAGVLGWPLKLLQCPYSKVCLTSSLPLRPNRRIFLAFNAPSQFFLRESRKAAAWWEHWIHILYI